MTTHHYFKHSYAKYAKHANVAIQELEQDTSLTVVTMEPTDAATTFGTNKEDISVLIRFQAMDGPLARIPLFVFVYFPWHCTDMNQCYPECPPTFWLPSPTGRYNADVYRSYIGKRSQNHSSMCLSMLRPKSDPTSDWKASFHSESNQWIVPSMDTVFASIQSMLCTFMVDQDYGEPKGEAVTMEKMRDAIQASKHYQSQYKKYFPQDCCDMLVIPMQVPAQVIQFNCTQVESSGVDQHQLFPSVPFHLANNTWTFELDVEPVRNYPQTVVSVMLVNASDGTGKKTRNGINSNSIIRTGVTGQGMINGLDITKGNSIWSYHGIPWQCMKTIQVTLHDHADTNQVEFTLVGLDQYGTKFVSGNSTMKMIPHQSDLYTNPVKLVVYTNNKRSGGRQSFQLNIKTPTHGYIQPQTYNLPTKFDKGVRIDDSQPSHIHQSSSVESTLDATPEITPATTSAATPESDLESINVGMNNLTIKRPPIYVGLMFSKHDTLDIHQRVQDILGKKCPPYKRSIIPGHVTLQYLGKKPHNKMVQLYETTIQPHVGKQYTVTLDEIYADEHGLCATVTGQLPQHPNQILHLTMKLNDKPPVYSNQMITSPTKETTILGVKELDLTLRGVIEEYRGSI